MPKKWKSTLVEQAEHRGKTPVHQLTVRVHNFLFRTAEEGVFEAKTLFIFRSQ